MFDWDKRSELLEFIDDKHNSKKNIEKYNRRVLTAGLVELLDKTTKK